MLLAIVLASVPILYLLMWAGWRGRRKRQAHIAKPLTPPADLGQPLLSADVLYVATTLRDQPLERVAGLGLGFRARARLEVTAQGVVLRIPGQNAMFMPRQDVAGVERATWTIDRVVESGGLVVIRWTLPNGEGAQAAAPVDSYFRVIEDRAATAPLIDAINTMLRQRPTGEPATHDS